jgi:hypothetical protein
VANIAVLLRVNNQSVLDGFRFAFYRNLADFRRLFEAVLMLIV